MAQMKALFTGFRLPCRLSLCSKYSLRYGRQSSVLGGQGRWGAAVAATVRPAARRRSGHRAPAARGCWAQRPRLGGGAGTGHQQPASPQLLRAAPPLRGRAAPRRAGHRDGQLRERHTPRQTRLEPLIGARASAQARRDRLNCRTP